MVACQTVELTRIAGELGLSGDPKFKSIFNFIMHLPQLATKLPEFNARFNGNFGSTVAMIWNNLPQFNCAK